MSDAPLRDAHKPVAIDAIESLEVGDGFAVVAGWASQPNGSDLSLTYLVSLPNGQAQTLPISLSPLDVECGGPFDHPGGFIGMFRIGARPLDGDFVLSAGGQEIARRSFAPDERRVFVPRGCIERALPVDLRGWVFHPALWLQGLDPPAVELRVSG
jgi:hypothetical protein